MSQLLYETYELFKNRPKELTIRRLSAHVDISESWLNRFATSIDDPGIKKVERLNTFLKNYKKENYSYANRKYSQQVKIISAMDNMEI